MSQYKHLETCIYCLNNFGKGDISDEHVPPKGLFPETLHRYLPKVPACVKCNQDFSNDDEYFSQKVSCHTGVDQTKEGKFIREKTSRALLKPEKKGNRKSFADDIRTEKMFKVGEKENDIKVPFTVDPKRIKRIVSKIIRGLHYSETKNILPIESNILIHDLSILSLKKNKDSLPLLSAPIESVLAFGKKKIIGESAFVYNYMTNNPWGAKSIWLLMFHIEIKFLVFIDLPKNQIIHYYPLENN